jgi:hypothetical protein
MKFRVGMTIQHPKYGAGEVTRILHPSPLMMIDFGGELGEKMFSIPVLGEILQRAAKPKDVVKPEAQAKVRVRPRVAAYRPYRYRPTRTVDGIIREAYYLQADGDEKAIGAAAWAIGWPKSAVLRRAGELGLSPAGEVRK